MSGVERADKQNRPGREVAEEGKGEDQKEKGGTGTGLRDAMRWMWLVQYVMI
jgi:hypothetical protein